MSQALEKVAKEVGTEHITAGGSFFCALCSLAYGCVRVSVAIAYVMQKTTHVFPVIGGRKIEHLYANIEALKVSLSQEQMKFLESVVPFDPGFPVSRFVSRLPPSCFRKPHLMHETG